MNGSSLLTLFYRVGFCFGRGGGFIAVAIGVMIDIVGGTIGLPDTFISVLSDALFATGLAAVGLRVLLTSDSDWEAGRWTARSETSPAMSAARA